jgi:cell wall-associated NlpC family hydrolase
MITVERFLEIARSWIGVPFHHQGRSRAGIDCAGLPEAILREAGCLPDHYSQSANYGRRPSAELAAALNEWCLPVDNLEPGVIITIRWPKTQDASHVAIYTGKDLIHAYRPSKKRAGGVVMHPFVTPWVERHVGTWKLPGVIYV